MIRRGAGQGWRAELLTLALAVGESAVVWLVVDLLFAPTRAEAAAMPAVAVFVLVYAGRVAPRWLEAGDLWDPWFQAGVTVAVVVTTLIAIKMASFPRFEWTDWDWLRQTMDALIVRPHEARTAVWGVVALSAYAWWRGRRREEPDLESAYALLRLGTLFMVGAVAVHGFTGPSGEARSVSGAVLVFFGGTLGAVAFARLRTEESRGAVTLGPRWLATFLLPVVAVAVVAVIGAGLFSRDLLDTLLWFLAPLVWALAVILRVVIVILAIIAFIVVSPILWLLSGHELRLSGLRLTTPSVISPDEAIERGTERVAGVPDPIRYLVALTVLTLLFSGATRFALRRRRRAPGPPNEDRVSELRPAAMLAAAAARLRALLRRAGRPVDPLAGLRGDPRWAETVAIREAYEHLLRWGVEQGVPRSAGATPREHQGALAARLIGGETRPALERMTERYNVARYGRDPATAAESAEMAAAWRAVQRRPRRR